jgi:putative nucleotidyltransferase with HDIG domain
MKGDTMKKRSKFWNMSLLARFSLLSAVLIVVIAVLLAIGIQRHIENGALQREAENAADQVASLLNPNLRPEELSSYLSPERYAKLDLVIRQNILSDNHIVRVKIWNREGMLIYSDERDLVGQKFPLTDELNAALRGEFGMELSTLQKAENISEQGRFSRLMEIYVPLRPMNSGEVLGAYEVYHSVEVLQPHIANTRRFVWLSVGSGFLVLYGSLFTLVRGASRELVRRNVENVRLYEEAMLRLTERQRAEEQLQTQLQRMTALRAIDMAITGSLDMHVTLSVLLDQVTAQLNVDAAAILLFNAHTNVLEFAAGRGFRHDGIRHTRLRLGQGTAGIAALERRLVYVPDLNNGETIFQRANMLAREAFVVYCGAPLVAKGQIKGVLEMFHRSPFELNEEMSNFIETLAGQAAIAIDNAELFDNLQRTNLELSLAYDATIEGWSHALDLRDKETEGHTLRVTEIAEQLARRMGMSDAEITHLRRGALLHDIGKMGVPDAILLKPGPLTDAEWNIMRKHPQYAFEMLSSIVYLRPALDIPYCHHERWDGSGYPRGLMGEKIPFAARIFAVVDVWDALTSDRPYRQAWTQERAMEYLQAKVEVDFDPQVVEMFLQMIETYQFGDISVQSQTLSHKQPVPQPSRHA